MESTEWEWGDTNDSWIWDVPDPQTEVSTTEKFYTINEVRQEKAKKYRTTAVDYSVHFNDLENLDLIREYESTQQIF